MKGYNSIELEDREVDFLLELTDLNGDFVKAIFSDLEILNQEIFLIILNTSILE